MKTAVLGAGAMGTMCATLVARHPGAAVTLWGHSTEHIDLIRQHRENRRLLPGIILPDNLSACPDIREAVDGADYLVVAIPTRHLRATLSSIAAHVPAGRPVISVVKGIETGSFQRPSQIIVDTLGPRPVVVLSGPCHAEEAARGLPATLVAAAEDPEFARQTQDLFSNETFRIYTNTDVVGVELAGALKNVIAIAAGICDGLQYGDNAKSALLTRGLVEMTRFGVALGGQESTFHGLAGIGDLITTCISPHGRNRYVGEQIGRGKTLEEIANSMSAVAEGVNTCSSVYEIARQRGLDMPIVDQIYQVLFQGCSPVEATRHLLNRPHGHE